MTTHDPLCPHTTLHMDSGEPQRVVINCRCALIARVRADERERCGHEALVARDRTRWGSDAWSRLDRLACDLFDAARISRGGAQ